MHMTEQSFSDKGKALLGKQVQVTLGENVIARGQLLGFGEGGDFELLEDDGCVHYCWPMLEISERDRGRLAPTVLRKVECSVGSCKKKAGRGYPSLCRTHRKQWKREALADFQGGKKRK